LFFFEFIALVEEVFVSFDEEQIYQGNNKCDDSLEPNIVDGDEIPKVGTIFSSKDELTYRVLQELCPAYRFWSY
jgi:hypothetical protein